MKLKSEFITGIDYLHCVISGAWEAPDDSDDFLLDLFTRCRSTGIAKVLLDIQNMDSFPSLTQRLELMETLISQHKIYLQFGGKPMRFVILSTETLSSKYQPGLELAKRSGFPFISTTSLKEAFTWLEKESVARPVGIDCELSSMHA